MSGRICRFLAASVLVTAVILPVAARPGQAAAVRVTMAGMKFTPDHLQVQVGDTVGWVAGDDEHTVTARDGSFDSSSRGLMAEGDEFRWRFRVAGEYPYYCRVHGSRGMQGVITVVDPSAPATTTTRLTPVTAAATTTTAAQYTTTTTAPVTTTSRVLATSSTTLVKDVVTTTAPAGVPAVPEAPPVLNPASPVLGSSGGQDQAALPGAPAAARRSGRSAPPLAVGLGAVALFALVGGGVALRRRGSRAPRG